MEILQDQGPSLVEPGESIYKHHIRLTTVHRKEGGGWGGISQIKISAYCSQTWVSGRTLAGLGDRRTSLTHPCSFTSHSLVVSVTRGFKYSKAVCSELQCVSVLRQSSCRPQLCLNNSSFLSEGGEGAGAGAGGHRAADKNLKTLHLSTLEYLLTVKKIQSCVVLNERLTFPSTVLSSGHHHLFFFCCRLVWLSDLWPLYTRVTPGFIYALKLFLFIPLYGQPCFTGLLWCKDKNGRRVLVIKVICGSVVRSRLCWGSGTTNASVNPSLSFCWADAFKTRTLLSLRCNHRCVQGNVVNGLYHASLLLCFI